MDGAVVLERARLVERVREAVAVREPTAAARLEAGGGHVVTDGVVVRPLDRAAGGHRDDLRVELDVLERDAGRLGLGPAAARGGLLLLGGLGGSAAVVAAPASGRDEAEGEAGAEDCCELCHRPNTSHRPTAPGEPSGRAGDSRPRPTRRSGRRTGAPR